MNQSFEQQRKKGAQEAESFLRRQFHGVEVERRRDNRYSVERYIIWTGPAHIIDISDEALAECFQIADHLN